MPTATRSTCDQPIRDKHASLKLHAKPKAQRRLAKRYEEDHIGRYISEGLARAATLAGPTDSKEVDRFCGVLNELQNVPGECWKPGLREATLPKGIHAVGLTAPGEIGTSYVLPSAMRRGSAFDVLLVIQTMICSRRGQVIEVTPIGPSRPGMIDLVVTLTG